MGRSAKFHKRVKKTASSVSRAPAAPAPPNPAKTQTSSASTNAPGAKRRANLKDKAAATKRTRGDGGHVLGGVDYVGLMMGGRRKAAEEAKKLSAS